MIGSSITFSFFLIFSGAAIVATLALYTRQPLIIAYIALGACIGPYGLSLVTDLGLLTGIGHVGIIFLLFLLGLDMHPQALWSTLRKSTVVAVFSSAVFLGLGFAVAYLFGFAVTDALITGAAMMFSSTIIGIKLLPTTVLHHRHIGELMISLLLLQDLLAILVLMALLSAASGSSDEMAATMGISLLSLPLLAACAWLAVRYVLLPLITRFDRFHEYIFLLALGWCLGLAECASALGLSEEIGAFIAGITIATSPISQYIAVNLKPLRDFFLILFFFSVGARFDLGLIDQVLAPALVLALLVLVCKPVVYRFLLKGVSEKRSLAWDLGFRLGQASEFSLLIAYVAVANAVISEQASLLIQATTIITLLASSYIVVLNYPTPIAISDRLRRD
ncbi:MAG: cation:proton antiporter [Halieaceae bacterium]|nr:cation:proton antiporter [Halieaceae bacterium]MCB1845817.1 cation:proton antiporter [Halieaceae bacterium]MCP5146729.1 cation:proton antiporter [Pseudomonadales bacterium]MCP5166631.1 cation:proton antiporter [Pseudomonadales bacterium]MCP5186525.1 cation:proton antiporter [Pseudomonadales bacterium]